MPDSVHSNQPQHRSALIAREVATLNVDIAALSKVRFQDEGSLQEYGTGYTFFWSGNPTTQGSLLGVSFMVSTTIAARL